MCVWSPDDLDSKEARGWGMKELRVFPGCRIQLSYLVTLCDYFLYSCENFLSVLKKKLSIFLYRSLCVLIAGPVDKTGPVD